MTVTHARATAGARHALLRDGAALTPVARRSRRQNVGLLVTAGALGLWLGVAAPGTSPVAAPVAAPVASVDAQTQAPIVSDLPGRAFGQGGPGGRR